MSINFTNPTDEDFERFRDAPFANVRLDGDDALSLARQLAHDCRESAYKYDPWKGDAYFCFERDGRLMKIREEDLQQVELLVAAHELAKGKTTTGTAANKTKAERSTAKLIELFREELAKPDNLSRDSALDEALARLAGLADQNPDMLRCPRRSTAMKKV